MALTRLVHKVSQFTTYSTTGRKEIWSWTCCQSGRGTNLRSWCRIVLDGGKEYVQWSLTQVSQLASQALAPQPKPQPLAPATQNFLKHARRPSARKIVKKRTEAKKYKARDRHELFFRPRSHKTACRPALDTRTPETKSSQKTVAEHKREGDFSKGALGKAPRRTQRPPQLPPRHLLLTCNPRIPPFSKPKP